MLRLRSLPESSAMSSALSQALDACRSEPGASKLLCKVLDNIDSHPEEPKYRRLNLAGGAGARLSCAPALALLAAVGFVPDEQGEERALVLPALTAAARDKIGAARRRLVRDLENPAPAAGISAAGKGVNAAAGSG